MVHVITSICQSSCAQECVKVCPVDAIHGPPPSPTRQMFIDPELCISCTLCASACPVGAPFEEEDVPTEFEADIARNKEFFATGN